MGKKLRVVVVTGGGSGMGRAIARRFAKNGDIVYIIGRRKSKLEETAKGFRDIYCVTADVTDLASIEKARNIITKDHKKIDVLVNNAGGSTSVTPDASFAEAAKAWNEVIETNLSSVFYVILIFDKFLARPGGKIVSITSTAAIGGSNMGGVGGQAYSASKAGIHGLSRTLVRPLAEEGITVNCVAPGVITDTEFFTPKGMPEERQKQYLPKIPVGHFGTSEEIAEGVFYITSDKSDFITGEILNINGGMQFGR